MGTARACPPAPDTRHSAGPSVCNLTGEQATPPVVTAHRSSPAPSALWCMSSPEGPETRAGTTRHWLDGPKGLAAHTRAPRSRGGYRPAGNPAPSASCSGRARVDESPAHLAWGFLERVVEAPSPSNPGLPAGKGEGASTFSGSTERWARGLRMRNGEGGAAWWRLRVRPPPPVGGGGMRQERPCGSRISICHIYMPCANIQKPE